MRKILLVINLLMTVTVSFGCDFLRKDSALSEGLVMEAAEKVKLKNFNLADEKYQTFLNKLELFSAKLSVSLYKTSNKIENLSVSPVSIYMALAMAIGSSSGEAKIELLNAVGLTEDEVNTFTKYLYAYLKMENYKSNYNGKKITSIIDLNNSIWIDEGITLKESGLKKLANNFNTDSYHVPFSNPEENRKANELLSKYINVKTRGLIDPKLQLDTDTLFTLVNTLYLKDFWGGEVDKLSFTKDEYNFTTSSGEIIKKVLLESQYNSGRIYETNEYKHFYIKTDSGLKLKILLPKEGYNLNDIFTTENLININNIQSYNEGSCEDYQHYYTRTIFPKFEASYDDDISTVLKNDFNVNTIFSEGKHMTELTDMNLYISEVIHQTKLKVDETGIEGAAVTILVAKTESAEPCENIYLDFVVDKSFGYILTDQNDVMLFSGVVNTI